MGGLFSGPSMPPMPAPAPAPSTADDAGEVVSDYDELNH